MIKRMAALPALGLAVSGCVTNLAAVKDDENLPPVGLPYQLPRTVVTATVVWTLERCDAVTIKTDAAGNLLSATNQNGEKLSLLHANSSVVEFKPTASFTQQTVGDANTYSIDYEELTSGTKTGSIKVEYHENTLMLKSINAKVDGKEAEALKSAFSLAGNVARIPLGLPATAKMTKNGGVTTTTYEVCNPQTANYLKQKLALTEEIKQIEIEAARIKAESTVLAAQLINGAPIAPRQLDRLQGEALTLQRRLATTKTALTTINQWLSVEVSAKLGDKKDYTKDLKPSAQNILALRQRIASTECAASDDCLDVSSLTAGFTAEAKLAAVGGGTGCELTNANNCAQPVTTPRNPNVRPRPRTGLIFREPVPSLLEITLPQEAKPFFQKNLMVAQFGVLRTLPLRNGFGESNTLAATFDKNGMPTMIEYTKPRSGTVELLDALDEGAQTLLAIQADRRAADKAATDAEIASAKNELEALQRQRDMIKVQAEIDALERATPTENETLKAEIETLELLKQIAQLKQAIRAAAPPSD